MSAVIMFIEQHLVLANDNYTLSIALIKSETYSSPIQLMHPGFLPDDKSGVARSHTASVV